MLLPVVVVGGGDALLLLVGVGLSIGVASFVLFSVWVLLIHSASNCWLVGMYRVSVDESLPLSMLVSTLLRDRPSTPQRAWSAHTPDSSTGKRGVFRRIAG